MVYTVILLLNQITIMKQISLKKTELTQNGNFR